MLGLLEMRTRNFLVRTSRMSELLIVWVNSTGQLVRVGTEVTNRREPRENRRTSRAKSIYRFNLLRLLRVSFS